jgi:hypothetical protein
LRTHQRKHERLGNAHNRELALCVAAHVRLTIDPNQCDAEQLTIDSRQRRIDARDLALSLLAGIQGAALLANTFRDPEILSGQARRLNRWIDSLA